MNAGALRKRQNVLADLRARIVVPSAAKPRTVLREPQPFVMEVGDVIVYPTCHGRCINPYLTPGKQVEALGRPWVQNDWGAAVVIDCGRAFGFLAWYRPITLTRAVASKPDMKTLHGDLLWRLESAGTCSPTHFKRLQLEKPGNLRLDSEKLQKAFPEMKPGISAAVSDISIANRLSAIPYNHSHTSVDRAQNGYQRRTPTINNIEQILRRG